MYIYYYVCILLHLYTTTFIYHYVYVLLRLYTTTFIYYVYILLRLYTTTFIYYVYILLRLYTNMYIYYYVYILLRLYTTTSSIKSFSVLPTERTFVYFMVLNTNNDLFPLPHELIVLYNQDGMCTRRGSSGILVCNSS